MTRREILKEAEKQVCGERQEDYGNPEDSFSIIASFWSTYLGINIKPRDVASMMCLLKIARIKGNVKMDSAIDLAGYAACIGEIDSNA